MNKLIRQLYYKLKPIIPRYIQIQLRRKEIAWKQKKYSEVWPILPSAAKPPDNWKSWPDGKQFALILTHDVDTARGQDRCRALVDIEKYMGFRSSFNFVPERYAVSSQLRKHLAKHGFEVGVHGLNHDGKLFDSKSIFDDRAAKINHYLNAWNAVGFRSPAMHHNLDWIGDLNIEYDSSTFDIDPFQPQPDGVETIFPFWVNGNSSQKGYVELPYTLPQDFILFVLLKQRNINIWKQKLDWVASKGGMALLNTHPDYMNFNGKKPGMEEYPARYYSDFLNYVKERYNDEFWLVLPHEISMFYKKSINEIEKDKLQE